LLFAIAVVRVLRALLSHVDADAGAMAGRYSELMPVRTAGNGIAEKQFCATAVARPAEPHFVEFRRFHGSRLDFLQCSKLA
jgi:hypothetical protein